MAFTDAFEATPGDPTEADNINAIADNTEFNREIANFDHDFAISGGTGKHRAALNNPMQMVDEAGNIISIAMWQPASGGIYLLCVDGISSGFAVGDHDFQISLQGPEGVPTS